MKNLKSRSFVWAIYPNTLESFSKMCKIENSSFTSDNFRASIFEKSRMSFTICSNKSDEEMILCT